MDFFILITTIINILIHFCHGQMEKTWIYEFKSVTTKTSNADLVNVTLNIERISRGVYALSGEYYMNVDIAEGDENEIEVKSFRSKNGDGVYAPLPLVLQRQHFFDALNGHYKTVLMETFKECSNLPYFEGTFTPPLEKKTYILDKCQISQDGLPNHLEPGEYKIIFNAYGDAEWEVEVIANVEPSY